MATVERLTEIALGLPDVIEAPTWGGDPGFKVHKKLLVHLYSNGRATFRVDRHDREALLQSAPDKFSCSTPNWPFIEADLGALSDKEVSELIVEAWRLAAPKRLVAAFDRGQDDPTSG